jgi:hypothetical protein
MPFTTKLLKFTFDLPGKSFDNSGGANRLTVEGVRASVSITQGGSADYGQCDITIYGLTQTVMNQLSTLGVKIMFVRRNVVTVSAGDSVNGLSVVYQGYLLIPGLIRVSRDNPPAF